MSRIAWTGALLLLAATAATAQEHGQEQAQEQQAALEQAPPGYFDVRRITPISGDPVRGQSRSELCSACHGPNGISIVPMYPDIAGQRADYMYWQLKEFEHTDPGLSVMVVPAADLTDEDMRDLSVYYAGMPAAGPPADADASAPAPDPAVLARGEQLYLHGDPPAGIPPCQACHGADARGHPLATEVDAAGYTPYAVYPALRSQREAYLVTQIAEYQQAKGVNMTSDYVMAGAAEHLDQASIEALAAWLSSLPR